MQCVHCVHAFMYACMLGNQPQPKSKQAINAPDHHPARWWPTYSHEFHATALAATVAVTSGPKELLLRHGHRHLPPFSAGLKQYGLYTVFHAAQ